MPNSDIGQFGKPVDFGVGLSESGKLAPTTREDIEARVELRRRNRRLEAEERKRCAGERHASRTARAAGETDTGTDGKNDRWTIPYQDSSPPAVELGDGSKLYSGRLPRVLPAGKAISDLFGLLIPKRPYCGDQFRHVRIRQREHALRYPHIQLNGPMFYRWVSFDVDQPNAFEAAEVAGLRQPNIISINPKNGHGHLSYLLATAVARFPDSSLKALRYFADVERGYRRRLGADWGYRGVTVKNPLHPDWRTQWQAISPYSLEDLDCELDHKDKRREPVILREVGVGRNVAIFEEGRQLAYREALAHLKASPSGRINDPEEFGLRVHAIVAGLNAFEMPLPQSEVRGIARSITKFVCRKFSSEAFSARQSARIKRRWSGHEAVSKTKPWEAMGISRSTYYSKRKAEGPL